MRTQKPGKYTVGCHKYSHMARAQQPVISSKHHITNCGWLNKVGPHGPCANTYGTLLKLTD